MMRISPRGGAASRPKDAAAAWTSRPSKRTKKRAKPGKIDAAPRTSKRAPTKSDLDFCCGGEGPKPTGKLVRRAPRSKRGVVLVLITIVIVIVLALLLGRPVEIQVPPIPVKVLLR